MLLQTFVFTALITGFLSIARADISGPMAEPLEELLNEVSIPEKGAFLGWSEKVGWATSRVNPFSAKKLELNCANQNLYPTHPQQTTKEYHVFLKGQFDVARLPGTSRACHLHNNARGDSPKRCLVPEQMEFALISDTYEDSCGQKYRAYWVVSFLQKDETMGTLLSQGRTVYPDESSQFQNDMIDGQTYAVPVREFLFLTELLPGDDKKISGEQKRALQHTHTFNPQTQLFDLKRN